MTDASGSSWTGACSTSTRGTQRGGEGSVSTERTVSLNPGMIMSKTSFAMACPCPHSLVRGDTGGSFSPHWISEAGHWRPVPMVSRQQLWQAKQAGGSVGPWARMAKTQGDLPWQLVRARPHLWTHVVSCVYSKKCLGRVPLQKTKPTARQVEIRGHLYLGLYILCAYQETKPVTQSRME